MAGEAPLDGDNLVVFYYLSASEIWLDERGDLWWECPYKRGLMYINLLFSV
jgi:hypothetical protein